MLHKKYKTLFDRYGVNTKDRIAHLLAQLDHESGLKPIAENLNYSSVGLLTVFKKYFPTLNSTIGYVRSSEKIANKVYANRMGNGDEASGDGWKYRGRGFIQITGKNNYSALSKFTGVDYVKNPDLLLNEADAMISALWFWNNIKGNELADKGDIKGITRRINGGFNGLSDRITKLKKWKDSL